MYKNSRRFTIWLVITLFLVSLWPAAAFGADNQKTLSLDQAIRIVKQNFTIPADYSDFSSSFNSSDNRQSWYLSWRNPSGQGGNFSAQINAGSGEIMSMNSWKPSEKSSSAIPTISVSEARDIGTRFLQQIIPQRMAYLKAVPESQVIPLTSYGPLTYTLRWERMANNIPVSGDGVTMEVNLCNGEITGYNLNWTDLEIPSPAGAISGEQAGQIFVKNEMLKLQYLLPSNIRPLAQKDKQPPVLVYNIDHNSNGVIDALTGIPLELEAGQWLQFGSIMYNKMMAGGGEESKSISPLTPEEEKEISQTANLISKEAAAAAVDKYIGIPSGIDLQNADLSQYGRNADIRIWNLQWSSRSSNSSPSKGLYAQVNAKTGELMSFNLDIPRTDNPKPVLSKADALKMAEAFIKKVYPQYLEQIKLKEQDNSTNDEIQINWNFNYDRVVNGIDCPGNGININVDRVNKRVTSCYLNWNEQDFPAAANVLGIDKANQLFLQGLPLTLTYMPINGSQGPEKIKLVYQPTSSPGQPQGVMINAESGAWLGSDGKPVSEQIQGYNFNDIAGSFAKNEIALLGQAGIFGEYGDAFHPNENITLVALLRAMVGIRDGAYYARQQTDQEIMDRAKVLGWLQNDHSATSTVNREMLARLITRYLDIDYLVKTPQLFQITFKDSTVMSPEFKGYAALTWGLGIIKGDGVNFGANLTVTRAEAAVSLVRALKAKSQP